MNIMKTLVLVLSTLQLQRQSSLLQWHSARTKEVHCLLHRSCCCWPSGSVAAFSIVSLPLHEILPASTVGETWYCSVIRKQIVTTLKKYDLHKMTVTGDCSSLLETCMRKWKEMFLDCGTPQYTDQADEAWGLPQTAPSGIQLVKITILIIETLKIYTSPCKSDTLMTSLNFLGSN